MRVTKLINQLENETYEKKIKKSTCIIQLRKKILFCKNYLRQPLKNNRRKCPQSNFYSQDFFICGLIPSVLPCRGDLAILAQGKTQLVQNISKASENLQVNLSKLIIFNQLKNPLLKSTINTSEVLLIFFLVCFCFIINNH